MPIHDQSYRRYGGKREKEGRAWTVITGAGIRTIIRKRIFLALLLFAWLPFVVRAIQMYLAASFQQMPILAASVETFRDFLNQQGPFVFFITIWVGAGLIAADKRSNALQIYLSKPLSRVEYVSGKLAVLVVFLMLVTWVPAMLLLFLQPMFAGSFAFVRANLYLFPAITLFASLQVLVASFAMLALSSLSKSSRFVAILYAGAVFFTESIFNVVSAITGSTALSWISFPANLRQVGNVIFRLQPAYATPWPVSLAVLVAVVALAVFVLERQVRGVEVVT
jgi:ABC-2 type transport system permease protein